MGRGAARMLAAATAFLAVSARGAAAAVGVITAIPDDWAEGAARHDLLVAQADPPPALQPVLSNGLVGWRVDEPHVFLAGVYSGEGWVTPSHRARVPATLALAVEGPSDAEATDLGTTSLASDRDRFSCESASLTCTITFIYIYTRRRVGRARGRLRASAAVPAGRVGRGDCGAAMVCPPRLPGPPSHGAAGLPPPGLPPTRSVWGWIRSRERLIGRVDFNTSMTR